MPDPIPGAQPAAAWPALSYTDWKDTGATLHMWTQIVGKIRLAQAPWVNHCWQVTLYPTARGLTTSPMPHGRRWFQIDFDFLAHQLRIETGEGQVESMALAPRTVADFYADLFARLDRLGLPVRIHKTPNEVVDAIPFDQDTVHASYDAQQVQAFFAALQQANRVFHEFRGRFIGKCSPVHVFWGSLDLAVTRFSGRRAPLHPGGAPNCPAWVMQDAYSHEVSSCGFWPGNEQAPYALFYAYFYPVPAGFDAAPVAGGQYEAALGEFVLPYEAVRAAAEPEALLLEFLQTSYEAGARLAKWDRASLERQ